MLRSRHSKSMTAALFVATLTLSACVAAPGQVERLSKEENFQEPAVAPEFNPEGSAADNLPYFSESLRQFGVGDAPVQGVQVVDHLAASGFDKATMQVSFDRSKTNLVADNIFVSVLIGQDCLIGQIVVADRSFFAEEAPAVGAEKTTCLIGTTRAIDW